MGSCTNNMERITLNPRDIYQKPENYPTLYFKKKMLQKETKTTRFSFKCCFIAHIMRVSSFLIYEGFLKSHPSSIFHLPLKSSIKPWLIDPGKKKKSSVISLKAARNSIV